MHESSRVRSRHPRDLLGYKRRRCNEHIATRSPESRLRYQMLLVNLDRETHVRAATQRRRTPRKTRLASVAHIARIEEMITELRGQFQSATLPCSNLMHCKQI